MTCDDGPPRGLGKRGWCGPTQSAGCGHPGGQAPSGEGLAERVKRKRMRRVGASRIKRGEYMMPRAISEARPPEGGRSRSQVSGSPGRPRLSEQASGAGPVVAGPEGPKPGKGRTGPSSWYILPRPSPI